jgi:hypothetical protein
VITFVKDHANGYMSHDFIPGAAGSHHGMSHHGGNAASVTKLKLIDRWQAEIFGKLLTRLKGLQDADGKTVLDNTLAFYVSEVGDGDKHIHRDIPIVLAGKLGGAFKPGQHVRMDGAKYSELLIAMMRAYGVTATSIGDGSKPLEGVGLSAAA